MTNCGDNLYSPKPLQNTLWGGALHLQAGSAKCESIRQGYRGELGVWLLLSAHLTRNNRPAGFGGSVADILASP